MLENLWVSRALQGDVNANPNCKVLKPWVPMAFNKQDNLEGLW
jgi:hypothetical protein